MEALLGENLLISANDSVRTKDAMKGKDLVMLYFSASWCPPCRAFTPLLVEFYNSFCTSNSVEIVFVSSDRDQDSFNEYFEKMPWKSVGGNPSVKEKLSNDLQVKGIPHLVVLDAKTGHFVTNDAKSQVQSVGSEASKAKELISSWKEKETVPIEEAVLSQKSSLIGSIFSFFMRNPMNIVALIYFSKTAMKKFKQMYNEMEIEDGEDL